MMWKKPVLVGTVVSLALTAYGVGTDVGAADGSGDNTVSHTVPVSGIGASTSSNASFFAVDYVANMLTGDEARMAPQDRREHVPHRAAPAGVPCLAPLADRDVT